MRSYSFVFLALLALTGAASAVGPNNALNDTGITLFGDNVSNTLTTEPATHPRQDASQGRDAAARAGTLVKVGGGGKGFDFTKIANNGAPLSAGAPLGTSLGAWGCTYDNVTGLLWEVKVTDPANHGKFVLKALVTRLRSCLSSASSQRRGEYGSRERASFRRWIERVSGTT